MSIIGEYMADSRLPDSTIGYEQEFAIVDFQESILLHLDHPEPIYNNRDFWQHCVWLASGLKSELGDEQRPYLKKWIQSNWFWFTEEFSKRVQIEIQRKLQFL